jgi:hypothetical protein
VRILFFLRYAIYLSFLFCVLVPVGLVFYVASAIVRTAYTNLVAGWDDHR